MASPHAIALNSGCEREQVQDGASKTAKMRGIGTMSRAQARFLIEVSENVKKLCISNIYGAADRKPASRGEQIKLGMAEAKNRAKQRVKSQAWCNACQCAIDGSSKRRHRENFLRYQQGKGPL